MHELLAQLETHLRTAWRYRWFGLAVAAAICLVGWSVVMLMPNQYRAETKIYIDTGSLLRPALRGIALDGGMQLQALEVVRRTLLSRPNLETIARNTDLDLKAKTPLEMEALIDRLAKQISVGQARGDSLFAISFQDESPQVATRIVEAVLNLLVERSLGESRRDTTSTRAFLDQQIKEYEARLRESEERLTRFKQENMGLLPGQGGYFQRLEAQKQQNAEAQLQLQEAEKRRDQLKEQLANVDQWISEAEAPAYDAALSHPLDARIDRLEESLDQMLLRYTERHPDVVSTRTLLSELKAQRQKEAAGTAGPQGGGASSRGKIENPLFQQLQIAMGAAEAEVSALQARVDEYKRRQEELGRLVDASLKVESEMGRLDRTHGVDRGNYQELVERREALRMAEEANKSSDMLKLKVVEPPRVPSTPASPKRVLLNAGVLLAGFGAGAAFAWLLGMLRPSVYSRDGLLSFGDIPVLGTVSRIFSAEEVHSHRVRIALFATGCVALIAIFGTTIALEPQLMGLVGKLRELGAQLV